MTTTHYRRAMSHPPQNLIDTTPDTPSKWYISFTRRCYTRFENALTVRFGAQMAADVLAVLCETFDFDPRAPRDLPPEDGHLRYLARKAAAERAGFSSVREYAAARREGRV